MKDDYTVEVWKKDARYKKGWRFIGRFDYVAWDKEALLESYVVRHPKDQYDFRIYKTWVTKKNLLSGVEFQERYDTPYYCSPSSETFWSS